MQPAERQMRDERYRCSISDCRRIYRAYEVLMDWISKSDYEWPGNHREVRRLLRKSDRDKPVLKPFIEEIYKVLNCGPDSYKKAKRYLKVRKTLQFKSPEEMYIQVEKQNDLLKQQHDLQVKRAEQSEYEQIRREELERARLQAVRTKIRAEIEDELRRKVGQELGFQETRMSRG